MALIDSGSSQTPEKIFFPYLERLKFAPGKITKLFNSHGHWDHMGGNAIVKAKTGAAILAHELDIPWMEDPNRQFDERFKAFPNLFLTTEEMRQIFLSEMGGPTRVDVPLKHGTIENLGSSTLRVVHAPGHSPGSICIYDEERRTIFTGDSLAGVGLREQRIKIPLYADFDSYMDSLERVRDLKIDRMYTSHCYLPIDKNILNGDEARQLLSESAKVAKWMDRTILEFIQTSNRPLGIGEITKHLYLEFGAGWQEPITIHLLLMVKGHLQSLTRRGLTIYLEGQEKWKAS